MNHAYFLEGAFAFLSLILLSLLFKPRPKVAAGMTFCEVSQLPDGVYEVLFGFSERLCVVASTTNPGRTQNLYCVHGCDIPKSHTGKPVEYFVKDRIAIY